MNIFTKKFTALVISFSTLVSYGISQLNVFAENGKVYSCDFMQLVKDGAKTMYGTAEDIIQLDEYTTAYLTYEGTYVDADGTIYLMGTNGGKGNYKNGSYIEFTAPEDGTVSFSLDYSNYFIDETYTGYSSTSVELTKGQKLRIGERVNERSKVMGLTFTPAGGSPQPDETEPPSVDAVEYTSPSTSWDFASTPASSGKNTPVIGGNAVWANGEIQFPAADTKAGTLTVDMENAIKNNVTIEFDAIDHSKALGQQFFNISIANSEEIIADFQVHPYDDSRTDTKGLIIGGETVADFKTIRTAWGNVGTHHIKVNIDYNARKVTVTVGNSTFTGEIPEGTIADIKKLEISSTRSKTAADRYISVDNLKIEEFTSTEPAAPSTVAEGYTEETLAGFSCRVKVQNSNIAVIYLASEQRMGTDNVSQLYDAKPVFDKLADNATLIAPQSNGVFTDITGLVSEVKQKYNAQSVTIIGQSQNAAAALSSGADKIITIAGTGNATPDGKVWVFAGYADETTAISDVKTVVNRLQTSGVDTRYTEYPFEGHKINSLVAEESNLADWILNDVSDSKTVDLCLFAGQSNMAGRGEYNEAIKCQAGHGYEYHSVTEPGVLSTVSEPFGKYENNDAVNDNGGNGVDRRSGDMVSAFMESYYNVSGVPIVGVQYSRGGTESSWWNNSARLTEAAVRYNEAKAYLEANGYTIGKKFMVWCQGCTDADNNRSIDTYKSNTKAIFNTLKSSTGLSDMFIIRIGHCKTSGAVAIDTEKDPRYKAVNLAQKALADEEENITAVASLYTDEYAALMRDQYHYHQGAYNSVGTIAGNNTAYTLYNTGKWTNYSEPDEIQSTPAPVEGVFEITSSETSIDVSNLKMYDNTTYRMYKLNGSYETVKSVNGRIANTTGGEVTIVPEYKFEFTNQTNPTDENIAGYVKVAENSYTIEKGYGLTSQSYNINANGCFAKDNPIKVDLANGFYDITVYRLGGSRADIYSNGRLIANNTTAATSQNRGGSSALMEIPSVKLADGSTNITFGNLSGNNERIASVKIVRVPEKYRKSVIWIAGDSETANYYPISNDDHGSDKIMITGFGQQLGKVLSDKYSISNYGQPSATVKTWYDECFESVNEFMQSGDTILIDFGINDSISSSNKITAEEMKTQMREIINAAKAKGVTPIIISPVYNSKYQHRSYFTYDVSTETNTMYDFAAETEVACIDLNKWTQLYVNNAIKETGDENWIINNYHIADNLHLTQHSAMLAASFIAAEMEQMGYETADGICNYTDISNVFDGNIRGDKTDITRIYSVKEMKKFMGISDKVSISYNNDTLTITANDAALKSAVVIKAEYNNNIMNSVKTYPITFTDKQAFIKGIDITANEKVYVWNSIGRENSMKPLSDVFVR